MITKQENIEVIQDRLASAGTPDDIRKFYPYSIIEAFLSKAWSDLYDENPQSMEDMAIEYDLTLSTDSGYYSNLTVRPIGSTGIVWVEGNKIFIPVDQGGMESKLLGLVEPGKVPGCRLISGTRLVFDQKPQEPVKAMYIPNFDDLGDDDNMIVIGSDSLLYMRIIQMVRATDVQPEEFYNDGRSDSRKVQKKNEFLQNRQ